MFVFGRASDFAQMRVIHHLAANAEIESDGYGEEEGEDDNEAEVANEYMNEIEISKVDEEQIITELVDASGQQSCTEA